MNIVVSFQDRPVCEQLAWAARRALANALARFAGRIRGITVRFAGGADAAGDDEAPCSLAIDVTSGPQIHLQTTAGDRDASLPRLAERAAHSVRAALGPRRHRLSR